MAIFEEHEAINRKVLARFSDACERMFSSVKPNQERIGGFLKERGLVDPSSVPRDGLPGNGT